MIGIIIPSVLIGIALVSIGFLIYKTYPQLTVIKEDTIPEIKEAKKKYEIVKRRLEDRTKKQKTASEIQLVPFTVQWKRIQEVFRTKVTAIADQVRAQETTFQDKALSELSTEEKQHQAKEKIRDAKRAYDQDEFEFAEKCFIEAVRIDPHAVDAYRGLASVYVAQDQFTEAKETYHFLHQLVPEDDSVLLQLADIAEEEGDIRSAVAYFEQALLINDSHAVRFAKLGELLNRLEEHATAFEAWVQAVELEPQNPKYLDNLIETGIMVEQIEVVEQALQQLRTVNPENKKITIFQDKLRLLKEKQMSTEE
jgi:tetratricopeptide (TPR) repeat protein